MSSELRTGVTIDGESTRDLDDALWVEPDGDGWAVTVAIADVFDMVPAGSEADVAAAAQGWTLYLPDQRRWMLPLEVEQAASLNPDEPKTACFILFDVSPNGDISPRAVDRGPFRSLGRLTPNQAAAADRGNDSPVGRMLAQASLMAQALLRGRREQGGFVVWDPVHGFATNDDGALIRTPTGGGASGYLIVQETMIAANRAVSEMAVKSDAGILYRNHKVVKAAPSQQALSHDIELALEDPKASSAQATLQRAALVLGRAQYSPVVEGHWALNVPCYTHMTSPLRRYADLVSWRELIIASGLGDGQSSDLGSVADQLNEMSEKARSKKDAAYKLRRLRNASAAADAHGYSRLGQQEFHAVLKHTDGGDAELLAEVVVRSEQGSMVPRDLWLVLFDRDGPDWADARSGVMRSLMAYPQTAVSLLAYANQAHNWDITYRDEGRSGPDHLLRFSVACTIGVPHRDPTTGPVVHAKSTKEAQQLAAMQALSVLSGIDVADLEPIEVTEAGPPPKSSVSDNPKGVLFEFCAKTKMPSPTFTTSQVGGDTHCPVFRSDATCQTPGGIQIEASGEGGSKQEAERAASAGLVSQLPAMPVAVPIPAETAKNAKSRLHELAQKQHWALDFETRPTPDGFHTVVSVSSVSGVQTRGAGTGSTKKESERAACADALSQISEKTGP